jgi:hypothetical protein
MKTAVKTGRQTGITLLEVMIGAAITMFLMSLIGSFIFQNFNNHQYLKIQAQLKDRMQMSLYKMERELAQVKKLMSNDTLGNAYLGKIPLPTTPAPSDIGLIVLPTIRSTGSLSLAKTCNLYPDEYFWPLAYGNSLFFARLNRTFSNFPGITNPDQNLRNIDIYQFVLYYVKNNDPSEPIIDTWNSGANMRAQTLIRWESKLYADYTQFKDYMGFLSAANQTLVNSALQNAGVTALWDPNSATANGSFYTIATTATPSAKANSYKIEELRKGRGVLIQSEGSAVYSVAYNKQNDKTAANYFPLDTPVPAFYKSSPSPDATACGPLAVPSSAPTYGGPANAFPGGFEVGIVGPNSGRSVFVNLTMIGRFTGTRKVEKNHQINAYARDL